LRLHDALHLVDIARGPTSWATHTKGASSTMRAWSLAAPRPRLGLEGGARVGDQLVELLVAEIAPVVRDAGNVLSR
jgi:hypothetical protein